MGTISLLPELVINQIAAGEVLEHPASAVKELLENSLDAGATEIRISIEGGGLQRIAIEDNGCGMGKEDALLCLQRHATSKMKSVADLDSLATMGFRGEALAAISAVSQLEIKTSNGLEATRVVGSQAQPAARNRGTSIEIRNLFYNTPARLKFQKSPAACAAAVLKMVQSIALARPGVAFRLESNGKPVFEAGGSEWKARAEEILGPFSHEVSFRGNQVEIYGLLGKPEEARMNRTAQNVFVNSRPITSPLISRAVKDGFGTRIAEGMFPQFLLFLQLSPDALDVNVHPQKREVRFRDEGRVYSSVREAVAKSFDRQEPRIEPLPWEFTRAESVPFVMHDAPMPAIETFLPLEEKGRPIALLGDYLLVQCEGWKWMDVRGAMARILFEEMEKKEPSRQPLLWPCDMDLGPMDDGEKIAESLSSVGFEIRVVGKRKLAVDAVPSGMELPMIEPFIAQYAEFKGDRKLAASVTKVSRASTAPISLESAWALWQRLRSCADSQYDPLGKKIIAPMAEKQIAEFFS